MTDEFQNDEFIPFIWLGFGHSKIPLTPFTRGKMTFPLSYQLKEEILEIHVLSSIRSVTFIAQDDELSGTIGE